MSDFFQGFGEDDGSLRGLARDLGFRFTEELDRQYKHDNPAGMPAMPLFRHGTSDPISELAYGRFGGIDVQVFDYTLYSYPDDPGNDRRSCLLFTFPGDFPMLTVGPHTRLSRINERTSSAFLQRYRITSRDPDATKLIVDDTMQRWLMGTDDSLRLEWTGGGMLGHVPHVDVSVIPLLLQQVYGVFLRIPDAAWSRYGMGYAP
jgi:hypothetical protein